MEASWADTCGVGVLRQDLSTARAAEEGGGDLRGMREALEETCNLNALGDF